MLAITSKDILDAFKLRTIPSRAAYGADHSWDTDGHDVQVLNDPITGFPYSFTP